MTGPVGRIADTVSGLDLAPTWSRLPRPAIDDDEIEVNGCRRRVAPGRHGRGAWMAAAAVVAVGLIVAGAVSALG